MSRSRCERHRKCGSRHRVTDCRISPSRVSSCYRRFFCGAPNEIVSYDDGLTSKWKRGFDWKKQVAKARTLVPQAQGKRVCTLLHISCLRRLRAVSRELREKHWFSSQPSTNDSRCGFFHLSLSSTEKTKRSFPKTAERRLSLAFIQRPLDGHSPEILESRSFSIIFP